MAHPFDGAMLRLHRASRHLDDAYGLLREWERECQARIAPRDDGKQHFVGGFPSPPPLMSVVVGDVVNNLRSALEYLVYELVRLDSGSVQKWTKFPICDTKSEFDRRRKTCLPGVGDAHADVIEALQPYRGVDWTARLRDISNQDKHQRLSVLTKDGGMVFATPRFTPDGRFAEPAEFDFGTMTYGEPRRFDWDINAEFTIAIKLKEGDAEPVLPLLGRIQAGAYGAVESFKADFGAAHEKTDEASGRFRP
jgi:hypothetical protein